MPRPNLFGWASTNPLYSGGGSGGINAVYDVVPLKDALINAGYELNEELEKFYNDFNSGRAAMTIESQSWNLPEPPADTYPASLLDNAKSFSN